MPSLSRTSRAVATLTSVALLATACSGDGTGSPTSGPGSGPLSDALDVLPASTELVRFVDRAGAAARLGIGDLEAVDSPQAVQEYDDARGAAEWAFTELGGFAAPMSTRGAFSELDVEWEARGALPNEEGRLDGWALFRLEDHVDLDAAADAMVQAGYREEELDGRRHLTAPAPDDTGMIAGTYPFGLLDRVTFLPEQQLVVTGGAQPVLDVVDGDATSLLDDGKLDDVVQPAAGIEYAELRTAAAIDCSAPLAQGTKVPRTTLEGAWSALGMDGLRKPESSALYVVSSDEEGMPPVRGVTLLQFADAATAERDAEARARWLQEGTAQITRLPMAQLYEPLGQVVDGSRVAIEWTYGSNLSAGVRAHQAGAGIASCAEMD